MPGDKKVWSMISRDPHTQQAVVDEFMLCPLGVFVKRVRRQMVEPVREGSPNYVPLPILRGAILWNKVRGFQVYEAKGAIRVHGNCDSVLTLYSGGETLWEIVAWLERECAAHPLSHEADPAAALWLEWSEDTVWKYPYESLEEMIVSEQRHGRFIDTATLARTEIPLNR